METEKTRHYVKEYDMETKQTSLLGVFDSFGNALRFFESIEPEPLDKWRFVYSISHKEGRT